MPFLHLAVLVGIYLILSAAAAAPSTGLCRGGTGAAIEGPGIGKILKITEEYSKILKNTENQY